MLRLYQHNHAIKEFNWQQSTHSVGGDATTASSQLLMFDSSNDREGMADTGRVGYRAMRKLGGPHVK